MISIRNYFYLSDNQCHLHAIGSFIDPTKRGFYVNFHAHKRYPFLNSVYKNKPELVQNSSKKRYLESKFVSLTHRLPGHNLLSHVEYAKCIEALLVNTCMQSIISADIIIDNIQSICTKPILCFSRNDTLPTLFAAYLVIHKLCLLNTRFRAIDLCDNRPIDPESSLLYIYRAIHQALICDPVLVKSILSTAEKYGSVLIQNAVKRDIYKCFNANTLLRIPGRQSAALPPMSINYSLPENTSLNNELLRDRLSFITHLSSDLIHTMSTLSRVYSRIDHGRLFLACAPMDHTPLVLILGRLFFTTIYLLPHSDIPSYEIPLNMFDHQLITKKPYVTCDPCGQNLYAVQEKELLLDDL